MNKLFGHFCLTENSTQNSHFLIHPAQSNERMPKRKQNAPKNIYCIILCCVLCGLSLCVCNVVYVWVEDRFLCSWKERERERRKCCNMLIGPGGWHICLCSYSSVGWPLSFCRRRLMAWSNIHLCVYCTTKRFSIHAALTVTASHTHCTHWPCSVSLSKNAKARKCGLCVWAVCLTCVRHNRCCALLICPKMFQTNI